MSDVEIRFTHDDLLLVKQVASNQMRLFVLLKTIIA